MQNNTDGSYLLRTTTFTSSPTTEGVIFYNHIENPPPSDVLTALRRIVEVYEDHRNIIEYVPGEWIQ